MPRDDKPDLSQWQPKELIAAARTRPLPDFTRLYDSRFMLIVLLPEGDTELASGLTPGATAHNDSDGLAFRTANRELSGGPRDPSGGPRDLSATLTGDVVMRGRESRSSAPREHTSERTSLSLARTSCHVVPISKRSEVSFLHHVSVGRARNHDIVLRHRSVSKFHAWFEITPSALFVKDCESRNHSFVNDERVLDRAEVKAGDTVKFGSVDTRVCTTEGLWRLVRG
jgi:hypothetical protein